MSLRRIKHMLLRLSTEEKVFGLAALIILISTFLPWYSVALNFRESFVTEYGFSGDLGVVGFVVFLLMIVSLAFLTSDRLGIRLPRFGFRKEMIMVFLMGESAFLLLLAVAIYTKRSLDYTSAELRFGLYTALISACIGAFAAIAQLQRNQKKETEAFFGQAEETESFSNDEELKKEESAPEESQKISHESPRKPVQERFFEEEQPEEETKTESAVAAEEDLTESIADEEWAGETAEEENSDEKQDSVIQDYFEEEPVAEPVEKEEPMSALNSQRDFFKRDAGLNAPPFEPAISPPLPAETEPAPLPEEPKKQKIPPADKKPAPANDFYADL